MTAQKIAAQRFTTVGLASSDPCQVLAGLFHGVRWDIEDLFPGLIPDYALVTLRVEFLVES